MRRRLDLELVRRGLTESRARAQEAIAAGLVLVSGARADRAGRLVSPDEPVHLEGPPARYVSRGGDKLAAGLDRFGVEVAGLRALDAGASTGGFTDCLLQRGAQMVLAVDVGYGQLDWQLRQDSRVLVMERLNARALGDSYLPFRPELITVDVSFISLAMLIAPIVATASDQFDFLGLVKPQFELGKEKVGKGGVVRDAGDRRDAIRKVAAAVDKEGLVVRGLASSGLPGPKGNRETFVWASRTGDAIDLDAALEEVEP
jgi:23S rRNA (cytidine1920-2'-O)/16S rRNA (cytidine1409-2'-O)-methyltransferase